MSYRSLVFRDRIEHRNMQCVDFYILAIISCSNPGAICVWLPDRQRERPPSRCGEIKNDTRLKLKFSPILKLAHVDARWPEITRVWLEVAGA